MEIELICKQLERSFNGPAWYGPPINEVLKNLHQEQSSNKFKNSHNLIAIVNHITTWRNFVIARLSGDFSYEVSDEMNFLNSEDLASAIEGLRATQPKLIQLISSFPEKRLSEKVGGRSYSFRAMLHGIIQHDLYHLGQISLLKR